MVTIHSIQGVNSITHSIEDVVFKGGFMVSSPSKRNLISKFKS